MVFSPKFTITQKINKALVEIERVRAFLDAVKLKDDWIADMQKKTGRLLIQKGTVWICSFIQTV